MKNLILAMMIIASLILTMACPSKSKIKRSAEVAFQMSGLVLDLTKATDRAFDEGLIGVESKDKAVIALRKMNAGAKTLTSIVSQLNQNETPSASVITLINKTLSDEIITPFLQFLTDVGSLAVEQAAYLRTTIAAIRIAILTIAGTLADAGQPVDTGGFAHA